MYFLGFVFLGLVSSIGWASYSRAESENVGNQVEAFFDAIDPPVTKRKPAQAKAKKTPRPDGAATGTKDREPASQPAK